ncbi:uncharacterized protein J3R85_012446 [Psidium guajava]|nr:uncharacterized protein J3R85_012446 [Psidium guajava]
MPDQTITIQPGNERDDDRQPPNQHQQRQEWLQPAVKFHVVFGLLKLSMVVHFQSLYIICEAIYLVSLIEVTVSPSANQVYWYLYIVFGTLGFELLLWTNLSLVMWLAINLCLLMYALGSSGLLARGCDRFLQLVQPLDDTPFSEVQL